MEDYQEIKCWGSIDRSVEILQHYKNANRKAKINFNGHWLFSDTVTLDNAYQQIFGANKTEYEDSQKSWQDTIKKHREANAQNRTDLIRELTEKGHLILDREYWSEWDRTVPERVNGFFHGRELGYCLDIIRILNTDIDLNESAEVVYRQKHSGASYIMVMELVKSLCKRGEELISFLALSTSIQQ